MEYLLFADEANPEQTDPAKFFIYGGVFVPIERTERIHCAIENLRAAYGFESLDQLKFQTRSKPKKISVDQHTEMKAAIYEIAAANNVEFCGYAILHAITAKKDHATLVEWGANILLAKYNQFLSEKDSKGWANFDRINTAKPYKYLQDKFANRVEVDGTPVTLENIVGYSFTCDGASHLSTLADVLVGGFRYIINEPTRDVAGKHIVRSLGPLFWGQVKDGVNFIGDRGLVLRPTEVKAAKYQADYEETRSRLTAWSKSVSDNQP